MPIVGPNSYNNLSNIIPETIRTDGSNSMNNNSNMNNNKIINLLTPINNNDAVTKNYCDTNTLVSESNSLLLDGSNILDGNLDMNSHKIINISDPTNNRDAVTQIYLVSYHDN